MRAPPDGLKVSLGNNLPVAHNDRSVAAGRHDRIIGNGDQGPGVAPAGQYVSDLFLIFLFQLVEKFFEGQQVGAKGEAAGQNDFSTDTFGNIPATGQEFRIVAFREFLNILL